jgi:hypothetical protein
VDRFIDSSQDVRFVEIAPGVSKVILSPKMMEEMERMK